MGVKLGYRIKGHGRFLGTGWWGEYL